MFRRCKTCLNPLLYFDIILRCPTLTTGQFSVVCPSLWELLADVLGLGQIVTLALSTWYPVLLLYARMQGIHCSKRAEFIFVIIMHGSNILS